MQSVNTPCSRRNRIHPMARVLVVDDQRNMRTTLTLMLRDAGFEVEDAADGDAATDRISAESDWRLQSDGGTVSAMAKAVSVEPGEWSVAQAR